MTAMSAASTAALRVEFSALPHTTRLSDPGEHERDVVLGARRGARRPVRAGQAAGRAAPPTTASNSAPGTAAPASSMTRNAVDALGRLLHRDACRIDEPERPVVEICPTGCALDDVDHERVGRHDLGDVAADERERGELALQPVVVERARAACRAGRRAPPARVPGSTREVPSTVIVRSARIGEYTASSTRPTSVATTPAAAAMPMRRFLARRVKRRTSARSRRRRSRAALRSSRRVAASGRGSSGGSDARRRLPLRPGRGGALALGGAR